MTLHPSEHIDLLLQSLHFRREGGWRLRVGSVDVIAGISVRGLSLTFTEFHKLGGTQYEIHLPANTKLEVVAESIRLKLELNHPSSIAAWDQLQSDRTEAAL